MEWTVFDTVVSPTTGMCFSCICGLRNLKLTLWYQADIFLTAGCIIEPFNDGVLINKKPYPITVYNVTRYNKELWNAMKTKSLCPGNNEHHGKYCDQAHLCIIAVCPYGLIKLKNV
ncbi:anti-adapter protein IraM [Citrobacter rodentium NBRC 105723 = DSM 16636]|nr:anti-adapter protein IraM [Citrobacter rodentium]KIQ49189.1 anti-adapter protein IraM [Citrobacter rodentium]QBY31978.1 anti-adapter protein IraM [Citrobacter rodentium]UHO29624.1 anti-adapter protein IraM [Citrobacter rodentium NBRC 105723 = DSM 16636]HAT8014919.1 anti-adapter protein IraM [Citrobacter rodentium NBRC 105723 = DSM 16636]HAT8019917.1 anti-adapter protein IraM [Citrobacter rodentium]